MSDQNSWWWTLLLLLAAQKKAADQQAQLPSEPDQVLWYPVGEFGTGLSTEPTAFPGFAADAGLPPGGFGVVGGFPGGPGMPVYPNNPYLPPAGGGGGGGLNIRITQNNGFRLTMDGGLRLVTPP